MTVTPLTKQMDKYNWDIVDGIADRDEAISTFYRANRDRLKDGLHKARTRDAKIYRDPTINSMTPKELFREKVISRLQDPNNPTDDDVKQAIQKTVRYDVYREKLGTHNWWTSYEDDLSAGGNWNDFVEETGWKGNRWDFLQLEKAPDQYITGANGKSRRVDQGFIYHGRGGKTWHLYFDTSPKAATWARL